MSEESDPRGIVLVLQKQESLPDGTFDYNRFMSTASHPSLWFENLVFFLFTRVSVCVASRPALHYEGLAAGGVRKRRVVGSHPASL